MIPLIRRIVSRRSRDDASMAPHYAAPAGLPWRLIARLLARWFIPLSEHYDYTDRLEQRVRMLNSRCLTLRRELNNARRARMRRKAPVK